MVQSNIIKQLMGIYKQAENDYERNSESLFYECLKIKIISKANEYDSKENVLKNYRIACQSYLDSDLLGNNFNIVTLLIAIAALLEIKVTVSVGILLIIMATAIGGWGIYQHIQRRKILEIYHVLENLRDEE